MPDWLPTAVEVRRQFYWGMFRSVARTPHTTPGRDLYMSPMYQPDPPFEEACKVGDRFVLMDMKYMGTINTKFGPAHKTLISIVTRESYPGTLTYSAIGAGFRALAERSEPGDFPHVAEYITVDLPGGKHVKRFAPVPDTDPRAFIHDDNDGGPIDMSPFAGAGEPASNVTRGSTDPLGF